jgi:hypothetical protein
MYKLNCTICNTNLKDFKIRGDDLHCKCPPGHYETCSGVYVYRNEGIIEIQLCHIGEFIAYYNNNTINFNNTSFEIEINLNDLELVDEIYKIYLKYRNNEIFI